MEAANLHSKSSSNSLLINDEHHSADWASMPRDILKLILERLVAEVSDYVHFAAVCKGWLSAARDHLTAKSKQPFFPVLLLPTKDNDSQIYRGWYNPIENRFVNSRLHVPCDSRCYSSSNGWLIFADENAALILYNPFTRATIHLRAMRPNEEENRDGGLCNHHHHHFSITRVVLSTDPSIASPENYEAVAVLTNGMVFFYKCGWSEWVPVKPHHHFEEATYLNGKFYVANRERLVACIDVCSGGPELSSVSVTWRSLATRPSSKWSYMIYLAGTRDGHLLLIERFTRYERIEISRDDSDNIVRYTIIDDDHSRDGDFYIGDSDARIDFTSHFKVYEVKESEGKMELEELKTLEDQSLILGRNDPELIWTRDFPEYKGNCIYYMDELFYYHPPNDALEAIDIGVFDLETECCKLLDVAGPGKGHRPRPIWILRKANLKTTF